MAAAHRADGTIDWDLLYELVKDCDYLTYDPPQKKPAFASYFRNINLFTPRAPLLRGFPCCGESFVQSWVKCFSGYEVEHVKISDPDKWFLQMMKPPADSEGKCPEFLEGVFWMRENVANENLVCLECAHWNKEGDMAIKHAFKDWTTGDSWWGSMLFKVKQKIWLKLKISPNKKWMTFSKDDYIYVLGPEDKLKDPNGKEVPFTPGEDLLRCTFNHGDPKQGLYYQYIMRRVARKDSEGNLVKTAAYQDLLERATRPYTEGGQGVCCNAFLCNVSDENYGLVYDALTDVQLLSSGQMLPEQNSQEMEMINARADVEMGYYDQVITQM